MIPIERREYDPFVAGLHETMGEAVLKTAWEQGRTLTMEEAIQLAVAEPGKA